MSIARSDASITEVNYALRDVILALLKEQLNNYEKIKKQFELFEKAIESDEHFQEPFIVILKGTTATGKEIIQKARVLSSALQNNHELLIKEIKDVEKNIDKEMSNIANIASPEEKQKAEESLSAVLKNYIARYLSKNDAPRIDISAQLDQIEKSLANAADATKNQLIQIKSALGDIKQVDQRWDETNTWLNTQASFMSLKRAVASMVGPLNKSIKALFDKTLMDNQQAVNVTAATTTATTSAAPVQSVQSLVISNKITKKQNQLQKANPINELHSTLKKKLDKLAVNTQKVRQILVVDEYIKKKIQDKERALLGAKASYQTLSTKMTSDRISEVTLTSIRTLSEQLSKEIAAQEAQLALLNTKKLPESDVDYLNNVLLGISQYHSVFTGNSALFEDVIKLLEEVDKHTQAWASLYDQCINYELLKATDVKVIAQHQLAVKQAMDMQAKDSLLMRLQAKLGVIGQLAPTVWDNILDSKKSMNAVGARLKTMQQPKYNAEIRLKNELLKKILNKAEFSAAETEEYNRFILSLHKDIPELNNLTFSNEAAVSLISAVQKEEEEYDKIILAKSSELVSSGVLSEREKQPEDSILINENEKSPLTEKKSVMSPSSSREIEIEPPTRPISKRKKPQHRHGFSYEVSKYFQNQLLKEQLDAGYGGKKICLTYAEEKGDKQGDVIRNKMMVLPRVAEHLATTFNKTIQSNARMNNMPAASEIMNQVQKDAHYAVTHNHLFRKDKTQAFYHRTERDSILLQRILNTDTSHMQKLCAALPSDIGLQTPDQPMHLTTPVAPVFTREEAELINLVNSLKKPPIKSESLVRAYTKAAAVFNDAKTRADMSDYALHCMLTLSDVDLSATLSRMKAEIQHTYTWRGQVPTYITRMLTALKDMPDDSNDEKVAQIATIMRIAREAVTHNHFARSSAMQALYQQLGNGADYLKLKTHYRLRYEHTTDTPTPQIGEAICYAGRRNEVGRSWRVTYNLDNGNQQIKSVSVDKLKSMGFSGEMQYAPDLTPLLKDRDLLILGRAAEIAIDSRRAVYQLDESEEKVSFSCC